MGKERTKINPDRQRQRFNREFKLEAVRLLELGQKPAAGLRILFCRGSWNAYDFCRTRL